jgi:hypothetical protein
VSHYKILFCTDLNLSAFMIYYQARFQPPGSPEEFLIRDAKQFTGLNDCQARSINKLEYHWSLGLKSRECGQGRTLVEQTKRPARGFLREQH